MLAKDGEYRMSYPTGDVVRRSGGCESHKERGKEGEEYVLISGKICSCLVPGSIGRQRLP